MYDRRHNALGGVNSLTDTLDEIRNITPDDMGAWSPWGDMSAAEIAKRAAHVAARIANGTPEVVDLFGPAVTKLEVVAPTVVEAEFTGRKLDIHTLTT